MKTISDYLITSALLTVVTAFTTVHADDYKIGAVNAVQLLQQSPQAEKMRAQIQKEFAPRDKELVAVQKKLKEQEDRLAKDSAIMSETERRKLERDIVTRKRDLKRNQDEFREDLTFRRNEEIAKIQKEIVNAIQEVAKQNNYDMVLSEGVLYASKKVDITGLVVEHLKKKSVKGGK
ncbi:MAG: OmpH family outer membrane protein [Gammaproteobacteria bacterium]